MSGEVAGVRRPARKVPVAKLLVDTGSEFSWLPEPLLKRAGVTVAKKDLTFVMANGKTITRSTGYAILRAAGFETVDEVMFGQPGDLVLLIVEDDVHYARVMVDLARDNGFKVLVALRGSDALSLARRDGELLPLRQDTLLNAGDHVLVQADSSADLDALFKPPEAR